MNTNDIGYERFPDDAFTGGFVCTKFTKYVKQYPYVGDDGIYTPCEEYALEGCASAYRLVISKEMFVEAYNKWIKGEENEAD